jgi:hypothetical protein
MAKYGFCQVTDSEGTPVTIQVVSEHGAAAIALPSALKIGLYGDSQTAGMSTATTLISALQNYPAITSVTINNQGHGGATTTTLSPSDTTSETTPGNIATNYYNTAQAAFTGAGVQWVYIMEGANDSNTGASVATHQANMAAICAAFTAAGLHCIVGDAPYSSGYNTVNIRNYQAADDAVCNGTTILRGSKGVYNFFNLHREQLGDGVHPSSPTGYNSMETLIAAGIYKAITETQVTVAGATGGTKRRLQ